MLPRYESSHSSALTVNGILRSHDINFQGHTIKTIIYNEVDVLKWRGQPPRVELVSVLRHDVNAHARERMLILDILMRVYDETARFLLKVSFHLNRAETRLTPQVFFV